MHAAPAYLALALAATPVAAQDMDLIEACAANRMAEGVCDRGQLAEDLGLLSAGSVRIFGDYGIESFAMLTSLRYAASALFFAEEGEGCFAEEERTAAVEIWSLWVAKPNDLPDAVAVKYDVYDEIMKGIVQMEVMC